MASSKFCFNSSCKVSDSKNWKKGWLLRNSDFAKLCNRCGAVYEEGMYCEVFHKYASGWRRCETCGKRVHCGCIVSIHAFVVLDAGGIECMVCSRNSATLIPNQMCPPRALLGWFTQPPVRSLSQTTGSASNGFWHPEENLFHESADYSNSVSKGSFEPDISSGFERLFLREREAAVPSERNQTPNLSFSNGRHIESEKPGYGRAVVDCKEAHSCHMHHVKESMLKDGQYTPVSGFTLSSPSGTRADNKATYNVLSQQLDHQDIGGKQLSENSCNVDSSCQSQICNLKPEKVRVRKALHFENRHKISNEVFRQVFGSTQSLIIPLFEKVLSASDAGRTGRLVLPKVSAEAHLPQISQPEGIPLKFQDINGKEWTFQFRFWLNNNSRMYVLEGIYKYVQSLQLQAGDTVSFGRRDPEGKLILGFIKTSSGPQSDQGTQAVKSGNEVNTGCDAGNNQKAKIKEDLTKCHSKGLVSTTGGSSSLHNKRKNSTLNSKWKRSRLDNMEFLGLKVTLEEAQGLFRSPLDHAPHVVVIEDFEFEEYEDAPVIGRPTIIVRDSLGEGIQWAQCDICLKWRKLPFDSLLPARWTCTENVWDPERSSCEAAQELTVKQLKKLLSIKNPESIGAAASKKLQDAEIDAHASEDLEALDNFVIQGYSEVDTASTQPTTKHPRHRLGCSCIVCSQPPSGGPKHQQNCGCKVCMMIRRRFQTMMTRRERIRLLRGRAIYECKSLDDTKSFDQEDSAFEPSESSSKGFVNADRKVTRTPLKGQIDLNTPPEREK